MGCLGDGRTYNVKLKGANDFAVGTYRERSPFLAALGTSSRSKGNGRGPGILPCWPLLFWDGR